MLACAGVTTPNDPMLEASVRLIEVCGLEGGETVASTLDGGPAGSGRVVFCADSGWLGNVSSTTPGRGCFQEPTMPSWP